MQKYNNKRPYTIATLVIVMLCAFLIVASLSWNFTQQFQIIAEVQFEESVDETSGDLDLLPLQNITFQNYCSPSVEISTPHCTDFSSGSPLKEANLARAPPPA